MYESTRQKKAHADIFNGMYLVALPKNKVITEMAAVGGWGGGGGGSVDCVMWGAIVDL
jgi:hypothetical protein